LKEENLFSVLHNIMELRKRGGEIPSFLISGADFIIFRLNPL